MWVMLEAEAEAVECTSEFLKASDMDGGRCDGPNPIAQAVSVSAACGGATKLQNSGAFSIALRRGHQSKHITRLSRNSGFG